MVSRWISIDMPSTFDVGGLVVGSTNKTAKLWMKSPGVFAGRPFVNAVFAECGPGCSVIWTEHAVEGAFIDPAALSHDGKLLMATVNGPVNYILRGERIALNALSRCSGVATDSFKSVQLARSFGWTGTVAGTRKVTPGDFRVVEKYGLLVGGAGTHRLDLSQMVMLKDNHIGAVGGSILEAVKKARTAAGFHQKIEVECQSIEDAFDAATAGADVVMLDNFEPEQLKIDARRIKEQFPYVIIEASGGITNSTMRSYLSEHVDVVSQGALTQGYNCIDYSLKIEASAEF